MISIRLSTRYTNFTCSLATNILEKEYGIFLCIYETIYINEYPLLLEINIFILE